MNRRLIGVTGAPGSGKSTYAAAELQRRKASGIRAAVLAMDGFHLPQAELTRLSRRDRMGASDTFDVDSFVATLQVLRAHQPVSAPGFNRDTEEPVPGAITIGSDIQLVIVEGNYLLLDHGGWEQVRPLLDEVVFLTLDDSVRRARLIARHIAFGKTPAAAEAWVKRVDEPNARLIAATASRADRILASP
ncbi:MAG: nucleoside/nucleotide kinase family protein [Pseudolysinimonas sp.]|uniref:nucleoside/nucleotide kinase family protein n=1 Tax=Pseudolysinimonas sp. TaxID=2680009 RepID=UPI003266E4DC